jgi:hypothetical protein
MSLTQAGLQTPATAKAPQTQQSKQACIGLTLSIKSDLQLVVTQLLHSASAATAAGIVCKLWVYADRQLAICSCD